MDTDRSGYVDFEAPRINVVQFPHCGLLATLQVALPPLNEWNRMFGKRKMAHFRTDPLGRTVCDGGECNYVFQDVSPSGSSGS